MMLTGGIEAVQNGKNDVLMKVAGRGCSENSKDFSFSTYSLPHRILIFFSIFS